MPVLSLSFMPVLVVFSSCPAHCMWFLVEKLLLIGVFAQVPLCSCCHIVLIQHGFFCCSIYDCHFHASLVRQTYAAYILNCAMLQTPHSGHLHSRCSARTLKPCQLLCAMLQKPLRRFLRVALLIPLFAGCFYTKDNENTHVQNVFRTLARLLGCLLLFFFANVLKTLVAKIMASHFHKEAHFEKMQEALQKVCAMEGIGVQALLCCAVLC